MSHNTHRPQVDTKYGRVEGKTLKSRSGRIYSVFLGIPYAKPPKRFVPSEPPEPWSGVKNCQNYGSRCIQRDVLGIRGEEDSLFLNVFTPANLEHHKKPLDVHFWVHGGGFTFGSGQDYGAKFLMDKKIVLVTINYRLGVFGFLHTQDGQVEGNLGLKDQVLALQWVQDCIGAFGGNKNRVQIFGESAGSAACHFLILSPLARGLFHSAVLQSGTALSPWALQANPEENIRMLAKALGFPYTNSKEFVEYLKGLDPRVIAAQSHDFKNPKKFPIAFVPSIEVEGELPTSRKFISEPPIFLLKSGRFNEVPIILGCNINEGLLFAAPYLFTHDVNLDEIWTRFAPRAFMFKYLTPNPEEISEKIRDFYLNDQKEAKLGIKELSDIYSDRFFVHPTRTTALLHASWHSDSNPVYLYAFGHSGSSIIDLMGIEELNDAKTPTHFDECQYLFDTPFFGDQGSDHERISKQLIEFWTNLPSNKNPGHKWRPLNRYERSEKLKWLFINGDEDPGMIEEPFGMDRMKFWDALNLYHGQVPHFSKL